VTDLDEWVPLAVVARPHGVRGEVRLKVFNKTSDVLLDQEEVLVRLEDGEEHEVSVEGARRADDAILMKLYSVDDRDRADELRGAHICVRRRDFPKPEAGEFYAVDAIGAEVRMGGAKIGEVIEIISYPTVDAMLVKTGEPEGNWEIPLSDAYIEKVDTDAHVVDVVSGALADLERIPLKKKKVKPPRGPAQAAAGASEAADGSDETSEDEG